MSEKSKSVELWRTQILDYGFKSVSKYEFISDWSTEVVQHFITLDKVPRAPGLMTAYYGLRCPRIEPYVRELNLFSVSTALRPLIYRYGTPRYSMLITFVSINQHDLGWALDVNRVEESSERLRSTISDRLVPMFKQHADLESLYQLFIGNHPLFRWRITLNAVVRTGYCVALGNLLGVPFKETQNAMLEHRIRIEGALVHASTRTLEEFVAYALQVWQNGYADGEVSPT